MDFLFTLIFAAFAFAFVCNRIIRLLRPGSCLVIFQNGQALKVVDGSAAKMTLLLPFSQTSKSIDVRNQIISIPDFYDDLDKVTPLVRGGFEYFVADPIKAINNARLKEDVQALIVSSLQRVLIDATIADCLLQKAKIEEKTTELTKLKAARLGVSVVAVNIRTFPRHRLLLFQIATLPYLVYWQLVEELQ